MLAKVSGWLRILTDGSPWAEDNTCIGCGRRQYRIEPPIGQGHAIGCAYIDAKAYLDAQT
jgi:hypothetical protein